MKAKNTEKKVKVKDTNKVKAKNKSSLKFYIAPFILLAVALFIEACLIFEKGAGIMGEWVSRVVLGVCGFAGYLFPVGLFAIALFYSDIKNKKSLKFKYITLSLFSVFVASAQSAITYPSLDTDVISISQCFNAGALHEGGGVIGTAIAKLLSFAGGSAIAAVMSVVFCLVALSFFAGSSRIGVWKYVKEYISDRLSYSGTKKSASDKKRDASEVRSQVEDKKTERNEMTIAFAPVKKNIDTTLSEMSEDTALEGGVGRSYADAYAGKKSSAVSETLFAPEIYDGEYEADSFKPEESEISEPENPMTASGNPQIQTTQQQFANATASPFVAVRTQPAQPRASAYTGAQGYSGQTQNNDEKPRAYSPFANPLMSAEEFMKGSKGTQKSSYQQKSSAPPKAYSPFADPVMSMNTPLPGHSETPQAYIANNAVDKYQEITCAVNEHAKEHGEEPLSEEAVAELAKAPAVFEFNHAPTAAMSNGAGTGFVFGKSGGKTQIDDDDARYEDTDEEGEEESAEAPVTEKHPLSVPFAKEEPAVYEPESEPEEESDQQNAEGDYTTFYSYKEKRYPDYVYPAFDLLEPQSKTNMITEEEIMEVQRKLVDKLASLKVEVELSGYSVGPSVTRYELTPGPGVKVKAITSLTEDIALTLGSDGIRVATVPGKAVVGVEVPNKKVTVVSLRSLIESQDFMNAKSKITVCVGLTVTGKPVYMDIDDMPHVLIAGQTKSGKSVAINCMLLSLLYRASPDEVQLILIDPKRVELNVYSKVPHLVMPVIDDPQRAAAALRWAVAEMERRYMLLDKMCVRNREEYYDLKDENPDFEYLPQIVIVIDELADLMLQVREHVEELINRLAAKARACGIHLLIGTQRPSVDIITGLIKANIPARISFKVSSNNDSRIILGNVGAERLLGRGDMIYHPTGGSQKRVQGAYVDGKEIKRIMNYIVDNNGPARFNPEVIYQLDSEVEKMNKSNKKAIEDEDEGVVDCSDVDFDYLCQAIELSIELQQVATNAIQRRLKIGFNRAANLVDRMEELGFISKRNGSKPRDVIVTWDTYNQWKNSNAK